MTLVRLIFLSLALVTLVAGPGTSPAQIAQDTMMPRHHPTEPCPNCDGTVSCAQMMHAGCGAYSVIGPDPTPLPEHLGPGMDLIADLSGTGQSLTSLERDPPPPRS